MPVTCVMQSKLTSDPVHSLYDLQSMVIGNLWSVTYTAVDANTVCTLHKWLLFFPHGMFNKQCHIVVWFICSSKRYNNNYYLPITFSSSPTSIHSFFCMCLLYNFLFRSHHVLLSCTQCIFPYPLKIWELITV